MAHQQRNSLNGMLKKLNPFSQDKEIAKLPLLSTNSDKTMIHNVVDVYGTTVADLKGNIVLDVATLFNTKYNLACNANKHGLTYKYAMIQDKHFTNTSSVATVNGNAVILNVPLPLTEPQCILNLI